MSLHIWAISHGVATLFAQGDLQARKVPMSPDEILESAMLVYLKGSRHPCRGEDCGAKA